ncbi:sugar-binding protein [Kiritimatiellaeota bacterium B1221]|nr:sugar-binding protein [Kiritimatiellaeota bacterium B1221]
MNATTPLKLKTLFTLALMLINGWAAAANLKIRPGGHNPNHLFDVTTPLRFEVLTTGVVSDESEAVAVLRNAFGEEVKTQTIQNPTGDFWVDFGTPGRGYYELDVTWGSASGHCSLGVMEFVNRTAKEVRDGGYVFGLKWWGGIKHKAEFEQSMVNLGLQWTRIIQNEGMNRGGFTIVNMLEDYPMNAVIKVERYPRELYDAERYGPIEEYESKFRGAWVINNLPQKEPYQEYLREMLKTIPEDQNVFEIWNEAWNKMNAEDFAELCGWIAEVILAERPHAVIGPNLTGDTGEFEYDNRVIEAGGMKGMNMVALHPYDMAQNRIELREYQAWIKEKLGHDVEIHITEYGSHSCPEGPMQRSEMEQARIVVRDGICLYSGGVKSLAPHWVGQSENNPTYHEDWFGFIRKNEQPKPVLMAHANAARMIDGSEYLGDLWFGPKIAAIVFEQKDGEQVLILWARDSSLPGKEENRTRMDITLSPDASGIVLTDIMGTEKFLKAEEGKIQLTLDESPVYLTGFGPGLLAGMSKELREDRWPVEEVPRNQRPLPRLADGPVFDGEFSDWESAIEVSMVNAKVMGSDASGSVYLAWDESHLYFAANVRDNEMMNNMTSKTLYRGDGIELFVSTKPREEGGGFGPDDYQFFITPTSKSGEGVIAWVTDREGGVIQHLEGAKTFLGKTGMGWGLEVAIPWSALKDFKPEAGKQLAIDMRLNDADQAHKRFKLDPSDSPKFSVFDPTTWSLMTLEDSP